MTNLTSTKSYLLVGLQFICLGIILLTGPIIVSNEWLLGLECVGILIGLWAVWSMRLRNLHVFPDVQSESVLVTHGPYRFIRHPVYTALLLCTIAMVLDEFSLLRLAIWVLLGVDLVAKLMYEESLLIQHFSEYPRYQRRTARLAPFIF